MLFFSYEMGIFFNLKIIFCKLIIFLKILTPVNFLAKENTQNKIKIKPVFTLDFRLSVIPGTQLK